MLCIPSLSTPSSSSLLLLLLQPRLYKGELKPPSSSTGGTLSHFLPLNTMRRTPGDKKKQVASLDDDAISVTSPEVLPPSSSMSSIEEMGRGGGEENNKASSEAQLSGPAPPPPIPPKLAHTSSLNAIDLASSSLTTPPKVPPRSNSPKLDSLPESYLTYRKQPHRLPPDIPNNDIIPPRPPQESLSGPPSDRSEVSPPFVPPHGEILPRTPLNNSLLRDTNVSHLSNDVVSKPRLSMDNNFSSQPPPRPPRISSPSIVTPPTPNNDKVLPPPVPRRSFSPPSLPLAHSTHSNRSESPPPRPPPPVKSATPPNDKDNNQKNVFKYGKDAEAPPSLPPRLSPKVSNTDLAAPPPIPPKSSR